MTAADKEVKSADEHAVVSTNKTRFSPSMLRRWAAIPIRSCAGAPSSGGSSPAGWITSATLTVRQTKFSKSRILVLHSTTANALRD